jgi:hypothetical protein
MKLSENRRRRAAAATSLARHRGRHQHRKLISAVLLGRHSRSSHCGQLRHSISSGPANRLKLDPLKRRVHSIAVDVTLQNLQAH